MKDLTEDINEFTKRKGTTDFIILRDLNQNRKDKKLEFHIK